MYVSKPKSWDDDGWPEGLTRIDVIVHGPQPTGLLDKHGNQIYRVADPIRLGFKGR